MLQLSLSWQDRLEPLTGRVGGFKLGSWTASVRCLITHFGCRSGRWVGSRCRVGTRGFDRRSRQLAAAGEILPKGVLANLDALFAHRLRDAPVAVALPDQLADPVTMLFHVFPQRHSPVGNLLGQRNKRLMQFPVLIATAPTNHRQTNHQSNARLSALYHTCIA